MKQQWEYITDVVYTQGSDVAEWLNGYGEDGWELVSAFFNSSTTSYADEHWKFIFKRPKTATKT